ncbi:MAG: hypothetical protein ACFFCS_22035 [Candidatus Hodarchaeota archaeon]
MKHFYAPGAMMYGMETKRYKYECSRCGKPIEGFTFIDKDKVKGKFYCLECAKKMGVV